MNKIIKEFHIPKYTVMVIDKIPEHDYYYVMIDGKKYTIIPVYDLKNIIAVESNESFIGKTVKFISKHI